MKIFKKMLNQGFKVVRSISLFLLAFCMVVLCWALVFNPFMHYLFSSEEEYMDDLIGMYESDAVDLLEERGFKTKIVYLEYQDEVLPHTVFNMFPKPFTKVKKNRIVELSVFKDRSTIIVPDYTNLNLKEVKKRLKKDKLVLDDGDIMYFTEDNISRDIVYHQKPKAGEKVLEGSKLIINVSLGQSDGVFKVPNEIIGLLLPDVILKLKKNRFLIGDIDTVYNKDLVNETVFDIYYNSGDNQKVEIYEDQTFTIPMKVNIVITKDEE